MRFVLAPVGSAGDVYPFVGLALALRDRGYTVELATAGYFAELSRRNGIPFVETVSADAFLDGLNHPELWHATRGFRHLFERGLAPHLGTTYDLMRAYATAEVETCVLTSCLNLAARLAQETHGLRVLTLHLQPAVLWSVHVSPRLPGAPPLWGPPWFKQWQFGLGCRWFVDGVALPPLNRFRRDLKLPPIDSLIGWWNSPSGMLGLFPAWFAPPQPDWPAQLRLSVFPRWTADEVQGLPAAVEQFLEAGAPPIVFTPGSAMRFGRSFFRTAVTVCQRLGCRGLLMSRFAEHLPDDLPPGMLHVSYAPFARLLPRTAAIVHHGGIGTTAQAIAAGIPQFIMPMGFDQPDNAARLRRLGLGDWLSRRSFTPHRVVPRLRRLLSDPAVRDACRVYAGITNESPAFASTCDAIEEWARAQSCPEAVDIVLRSANKSERNQSSKGRA